VTPKLRASLEDDLTADLVLAEREVAGARVEDDVDALGASSGPGRPGTHASSQISKPMRRPPISNRRSPSG
jgi:hypothetical protein